MRPASFAAVVWDVDGTLVDSEPLHHRSLVAASAGFGTDFGDLSTTAFVGVHMNDVWRLVRHRLPADLREEDWLAAIDRHYIAERHTLAAIPGAVATIRALADRAIPQACVSNSSRAVVDANLDALGIADLVAFSISLDDVVRGKPDPEPYQRAATRLGLDPSRLVAVEDSAAGLASARAAGLYAVGFDPTGTGLAGCDLRIGEIGAVLDLFSDGRAGRSDRAR